MKKHFFLFFLLSALLISCTEKESSISGGESSSPKSGLEIAPDSLSLSVKSLNTNDTLNHYRGLFQLGNAFFISGTDGKIVIKTFQLENSEIVSP